jgi:hypothetical protein
VEKRKLRIQRLKVENFMRVELIDLIFDGDHIVIAGDNAEGKSSYLRGFEWILRGKRAQPAEPIRRGAKKAKGVVALCDREGNRVLTAERTVEAGNEKLMVRFASKNANEQKPQAILDTLYSLVALRPMRLEAMKPQELGEELRKLSGCDTRDLEARHAEVTQERLLVGRERDRAEANTQTATAEAESIAKKPLPFPDAPAEEVSITALANELERARNRNEDNQRLRDVAVNATNSLSRAELDVRLAREKIVLLEAKLAEARQALSECEQAEVEIRERVRSAQSSSTDRVDVDLEPIRQQLASADQVNQQVRSNAAARALADSKRTNAKRLGDEWDKHRESYQQYTEQLRALEQQKRDRIASAKMPVVGLGFAPDGSATYNDLPLEQASEAERYRVYAAIAAAQEPDLSVLVLEHATKLDAKSRRIWAEIAEEYGMQIVEESLDTSIPGAVVIQGGRVVEKHRDTDPAPAPDAG